MLKIRLRRRGKNKYATYRIVVAEHSAPVKGRFVADLGFYNPHSKELSIKKEDVTQWMSKGAQLSATVHNLLVNHKLLDAPKLTSWKPKRKKAEEAKTAA
jgi:small subunit ribosomal protein S16